MKPAYRRPCTERRQLDLPSADDVQSLVAPISELQWASLRPELRPLLTNLKILDWLVASARSGKAINPASIISVSYLMDALWERWVEGDTDQLGRSHLIMRLGRSKATRFSPACRACSWNKASRLHWGA